MWFKITRHENAPEISQSCSTIASLHSKSFRDFTPVLLPLPHLPRYRILISSIHSSKSTISVSTKNSQMSVILNPL